MAGRMTNQQVFEFIAGVNAMNACGAYGDDLKTSMAMLTAVAQEISADRSHEVALAETVKALADALAAVPDYGRADDGLPCWCACREGPHLTKCETARAALRRAGRLP